MLQITKAVPIYGLAEKWFWIEMSPSCFGWRELVARASFYRSRHELQARASEEGYPLVILRNSCRCLETLASVVTCKFLELFSFW